MFFGRLGRKQTKDEYWRYWFTGPGLSLFQSHFRAYNHYYKAVQSIYVVVLDLWTAASLFLAPTISCISLLTPNLSPELIAQDCKFSNYKHLLRFQNTFEYVGCVGRVLQNIDVQ